MSKPSKQEEVDRGARAKRLLEDPTLVEAFANVRTAILERIEAAPIRDREGLHELKLMLKLLRDVRGNLEQAVSNGKIARLDIERERRGIRNWIGV
jgi:hypothetical protein